MGSPLPYKTGVNTIFSHHVQLVRKNCIMPLLYLTILLDCCIIVQKEGIIWSFL